MFSKYIKFSFALLFLFCLNTSSAQCKDDDDEPCFSGCDPAVPDGVIDYPRVHSLDPNDITGNLGYDFQDGKWVSVNEQLGYLVRFENDPDFATAPAQAVEITVPLDSNVNILDFRLSDFGFGQFNFQVPPNSSFYSARLDVVDSMGLFVDISAGVDIVNRRAFWKFQSIDPATGLPPEDALSGFLPVNDTTVTIYTDTLTQQGEGYISFTIKPIPSAMTGDSIHEQASIVFDINEPIPTNIWKNVIDAFPPVSQMEPTQSNVDTNFLWIYWTAQDDTGGVGVDNYDLFVSKNGAPFYLFQEKIDTTAFLFEGENNAEYCFYTLATDFVKNKEAQKTEGDICVTLGVRDSIEISSPLFNEQYCGNHEMIIEWETTDIDLVNIFLSIDGGNTYFLIEENISTVNSPLTFLIPDTINSENCFIQIMEVGGNEFVATSDRFSIGQDETYNTTSTSCDPNDVGIFENNFTNQFGCDSTVINTVTYSEFDEVTINQTTCIVSDTSTIVNVLQNQYGCDSTVTIITTFSQPEITGLQSEEIICLGEEIQFDVNGGDTYSWSPAAGLSNPTISNPLATPSQTTTYVVTSNFPGGCVISDSVTIVVNEAIAPTIIISTDTLFSSVASSYQWMLDGQIIMGATDIFYEAMMSGNYSVEITDANGCTAISEVTFITVGTTDLYLKNLMIRPNPASDHVIIELETLETLENFEIEIVDIVGRKMMSYHHGTLINKWSTMIHLDQYSSGVYILLLKSENRVHAERIIVGK